MDYGPAPNELPSVFEEDMRGLEAPRDKPELIPAGVIASMIIQRRREANVEGYVNFTAADIPSHLPVPDPHPINMAARFQEYETILSRIKNALATPSPETQKKRKRSEDKIPSRVEERSPMRWTEHPRETSNPGLGYEGMSSGDLFEQYRRQRSSKYHRAIATAFQTKAPSADEKLCYICHKPGHVAKNCKFGIS